MTQETWRRRGDIRILPNIAVKDSYRGQTAKIARNWPHKKNDPPPGATKTRDAKPHEILCVKKIYHAA
jgi:hypothetical protein